MDFLFCFLEIYFKSFVAPASQQNHAKSIQSKAGVIGGHNAKTAMMIHLLMETSSSTIITVSEPILRTSHPSVSEVLSEPK
jgi:hypothetical protein